MTQDRQQEAWTGSKGKYKSSTTSKELPEDSKPDTKLTIMLQQPKVADTSSKSPLLMTTKHQKEEPSPRVTTPTLPATAKQPEE